eukprot:4813035-Pyramimonas_sp.AAC.1
MGFLQDTERKKLVQAFCKPDIFEALCAEIELTHPALRAILAPQKPREKNGVAKLRSSVQAGSASKDEWGAQEALQDRLLVHVAEEQDCAREHGVHVRRRRVAPRRGEPPRGR